jgi:hypothetical protein
MPAAPTMPHCDGAAWASDWIGFGSCFDQFPSTAKRIFANPALVSTRPQSRCSSQMRDTQLTGFAPACIMRSRPARWAASDVLPQASTTG